MTAQSDRKPPVETGTRLATFEREREGGEVRWTFDRYEGRPFVSGRIWTRGHDGNFYPSQKGVTVRLKELGDVIAGLERALRLASGEREEPGVDPIPFGGEPTQPDPSTPARAARGTEMPDWLKRRHEKMDREGR